MRVEDARELQGSVFDEAVSRELLLRIEGITNGAPRRVGHPDDLGHAALDPGNEATSFVRPFLLEMSHHLVGERTGDAKLFAHPMVTVTRPVPVSIRPIVAAPVTPFSASFE